jgi:hypothetical protein
LGQDFSKAKNLVIGSVSVQNELMKNVRKKELDKTTLNMQSSTLDNH